MGDTRGWFDDDALWKTMTPHMFSEKILAMAPEETDGVLALLGIAPPRR